MRPWMQVFTLILAGGVFFSEHSLAQSQTPSIHSPLDSVLHRAVCERIDGPIVFATRDTAFALSLPTDEPATLYLQLTVGRNGKVKEKQTKVHANHLAESIIPTFKAATEKLRVDRSLLGGLIGKDTSLVVAFPMEYQCVYDTLEYMYSQSPFSRTFQLRDYNPGIFISRFGTGERALQTEIRIHGYMIYYDQDSQPTRIWYYLAFLQKQE